MTGQLVSFSAFGLPLTMMLVFRASRRRLLLIGGALAGGLLALTGESSLEGVEGNEIVPFWVTAIFILGLFALWCAGIAAGWFVRRRLS